MVIKKKKRDYDRDKLATLTIRVTIEQKERLERWAKIGTKGNKSEFIRQMLDFYFLVESMKIRKNDWCVSLSR